MSKSSKDIIELPEFKISGEISFETALKNRKSVRDFKDDPLSLEQVSQLLWAAHGVSHGSTYYTVPSAGALYPLEIYIIAERIENFGPGLYHYLPIGHKIQLLRSGSFLKTVSNVAYGQRALSNCPVVFIISGVISRSEKKYRERARRYVQIEVGHAGQNILLQAVALGLGSVPMGAFIDEQLKEKLSIEGEPFYLLPVGYPK